MRDEPELEIAYRLDGADLALNKPVVVLVCGLGQQLIDWPEAFVAPLARSGRTVLRFDNRDCGQSTLLEHLAPANEVVLALKERFPGRLNLGSRAAHYSLRDMAEDVILLLDRLGITNAHVIGMSMGGMIAQILLTQYPERIRSTTIIMSCPGPSNGPALPSIPFCASPTHSKFLRHLIHKCFNMAVSPHFVNSTPSRSWLCASWSAAKRVQRKRRGADRG